MRGANEACGSGYLENPLNHSHRNSNNILRWFIDRAYQPLDADSFSGIWHEITKQATNELPVRA